MLGSIKLLPNDSEELIAYKRKIQDYRGWALRVQRNFRYKDASDAANIHISGLKFHYSVAGKSLCGVSMFYEEGLLDFVHKEQHHQVETLTKTGIRKHKRVVCKKCLQALERALREGKRGN